MKHVDKDRKWNFNLHTEEVVWAHVLQNRWEGTVLALQNDNHQIKFQYKNILWPLNTMLSLLNECTSVWMKQACYVVYLHRKIWTDILCRTCERIARSPRAQRGLVGHGHKKTIVSCCPYSWVVRSWFWSTDYAVVAMETQYRVLNKFAQRHNTRCPPPNCVFSASWLLSRSQGASSVI